MAYTVIAPKNEGYGFPWRTGCNPHKSRFTSGFQVAFLGVKMSSWRWRLHPAWGVVPTFLPYKIGSKDPPKNPTSKDEYGSRKMLLGLEYVYTNYIYDT